MLVSCHSHSGEFCKHGQDKLYQIINQAVKLGFKTYCLTEHMPRYDTMHLYPEEKGLLVSDLIDQFNQYYKTALELKRAESRISLIVGFETEWINSEYSTYIKQIMKSLKINFIVASLHHLNEIPIDFDLETFKSIKKPSNEIFKDYYDCQLEMIKELENPNVIGHFDLIRTFEDYWDEDICALIIRNLREIYDRNLIVELNSRSFYKGINSFHMLNFMVLLKALDVKVTISDDSHSVSSVGAYYKEFNEFLKVVGFEGYFVPTDNNGIIEWKYVEFDESEEFIGFPRIKPSENWNERLKEIKKIIPKLKVELNKY